MRTVTCFVCCASIDGERFIQARRKEVYCSESCLVANVRHVSRSRRAVRRRWLLGLSAIALTVIGAGTLWTRFHMPQPQSISFEPPQFRPVAVRPEPVYYGPAWPPTDEDWLYAFANSAWTYPLPGPARRAPAADDRILAVREPAGRRSSRELPIPPPVCRAAGRCGVDLGGELWGEHVYAVHDGVVDRVQHAAGDEQGGVYLRIAHFDGMVFTHYFHLAAVPRRYGRGAQVKAGELIGLVGDTGNEHPGRYVHFALSVRPAPEIAEVYWDPTPLMAGWPLRLPPHGTVAGFALSQSELEVPPARHRATR